MGILRANVKTSYIDYKERMFKLQELKFKVIDVIEKEY